MSCSQHKNTIVCSQNKFWSKCRDTTILSKLYLAVNQSFLVRNTKIYDSHYFYFPKRHEQFQFLKHEKNILFGQKIVKKKKKSLEWGQTPPGGSGKKPDFFFFLMNPSLSFTSVYLVSKGRKFTQKVKKLCYFFRKKRLYIKLKHHIPPRIHW